MALQIWRLIRQVGARMNKEVVTLDHKQNNMRGIGTGHLPPIMNYFDLLPVHNFRYGTHPQAKALRRLGLGRDLHSEDAGWLLVWLHDVLRPRRG